MAGSSGAAPVDDPTALPADLSTAPTGVTSMVAEMPMFCLMLSLSVAASAARRSSPSWPGAASTRTVIAFSGPSLLNSI